jgi:hypothetical protein
MMIDDDLQDALRVALAALCQAAQAAEVRLAPDQVGEVNRRLAQGSGQLALFVRMNATEVHMELAMIDAAVPSVFTAALLTMDSPLTAAVAPPDRVGVINRQKMN